MITLYFQHKNKLLQVAILRLSIFNVQIYTCFLSIQISITLFIPILWFATNNNQKYTLTKTSFTRIKINNPNFRTHTRKWREHEKKRLNATNLRVPSGKPFLVSCFASLPFSFFFISFCGLASSAMIKSGYWFYLVLSRSFFSLLRVL